MCQTSGWSSETRAGRSRSTGPEPGSSTDPHGIASGFTPPPARRRHCPVSRFFVQAGSSRSTARTSRASGSSCSKVTRGRPSSRQARSTPLPSERRSCISRTAGSTPSVVRRFAPIRTPKGSGCSRLRSATGASARRRSSRPARASWTRRGTCSISGLCPRGALAPAHGRTCRGSRTDMATPRPRCTA